MSEASEEDYGLTDDLLPRAGYHGEDRDESFIPWPQQPSKSVKRKKSRPYNDDDHHNALYAKHDDQVSSPPRQKVIPSCNKCRCPLLVSMNHQTQRQRRKGDRLVFSCPRCFRKHQSCCYGCGQAQVDIRSLKRHEDACRLRPKDIITPPRILHTRPKSDASWEPVSPLAAHLHTVLLGKKKNNEAAGLATLWQAIGRHRPLLTTPNYKKCTKENLTPISTMSQASSKYWNTPQSATTTDQRPSPRLLLRFVQDTSTSPLHTIDDTAVTSEALAVCSLRHHSKNVSSIHQANCTAAAALITLGQQLPFTVQKKKDLSQDDPIVEDFASLPPSSPRAPLDSHRLSMTAESFGDTIIEIESPPQPSCLEPPTQSKKKKSTQPSLTQTAQTQRRGRRICALMPKDYNAATYDRSYDLAFSRECRNKRIKYF